MKLFKTTLSNQETFIDLDSIVYAYKTEWNPYRGPDLPCIKVGLKTKTDCIWLLYDDGDYMERDQEYDNLIKALEGKDDWLQGLPQELLEE